jgi:protein O-GlcNAc transferase
MSAVEKQFQNALKAMNGGKSLEAQQLFKNILSTQPNNVAALNLLTIVLMSMERHAEAETFISKAVALNDRSDVSYYNYGLISKKLGKLQQALQQFSLALRINSKVPETWNNRGTVFNDLKQHKNAISDFDQALLLAPDYSDALCNKGKSLSELKRYDEAFAAYDRALALTPGLAEAWLGRGKAYNYLKRYDEALVAFDKALELKPDLAEAWLGRGNILHDFKRHDEAFAAFDQAQAFKPDLAEAWLGRGNLLYGLKHHCEAIAAYDKALAIKPDLAEAWLGRGNIFHQLKRFGEAFAAHDKALASKPDLAEAWLGRGSVLFEFKRYDEALAAYDKAVAFSVDLAEAWLGRGNALYDLKRYGEAFAAFDEALVLKPDLRNAEGVRLDSKMQLCDWTSLDAECAKLIASVKDGKPVASPFFLLGVSSSPEDQLRCAKLWVKEDYPSSQNTMWRGGRYRHDRIRVAYLSADFREHPVSFLIAGMLECHDKSRFEVTAISFGADDHSAILQRLKASVEHFIDAGTLSDEQIVDLARSTEVDILVDLMGFTADSRTGILAGRAAPIQVNYLGYAGTMGAEFMDYILADRLVIPERRREYYSEKVVHLPNSFMASDSRRKKSEHPPGRLECNLPETGFVFCSFNNGFKIRPGIFDIWMRLLRQVDNSVLWLSNTNEIAIRNLRREAENRGVDPGRLVFAKRVPLIEDHLARYELADLFLDTLPYNAHATASDALWAGLPVLTCPGDSFASSVAASLLNAIGLPELVAATLESYERMAIDFAMHPEKLAAVKRKLAENRLTTPLFDTKLFTRHIEAAYTAMYERHQAGLAPDAIVVPN